MAKDLTFADIVQIEDRAIKQFFVPEWDGNVYIRVMSAKERSEVEDLFTAMKSNQNSGKFRKELLRRTWVNADGTVMFVDDAVAQHLMGKSAIAIERIFEESCRLNAFLEKDVDTLKKK